LRTTVATVPLRSTLYICRTTLPDARAVVEAHISDDEPQEAGNLHREDGGPSDHHIQKNEKRK
jgi:(2Fe-2S) ferredoxin